MILLKVWMAQNTQEKVCLVARLNASLLFQ